MIQRRRFLHFAGLSGLSLLGIPGLGGCASPESSSEDPKPDPKPDPLPDDPDKAWWLRKDYAPVEESEASNLEIVGALPPSLAGVYLRNGPNPLSGESDHWFTA
jgi:hypothetical protein